MELKSAWFSVPKLRMWLHLSICIQIPLLKGSTDVRSIGGIVADMSQEVVPHLLCHGEVLNFCWSLGSSWWVGQCSLQKIYVTVWIYIYIYYIYICVFHFTQITGVTTVWPFKIWCISCSRASVELTATRPGSCHWKRRVEFRGIGWIKVCTVCWFQRLNLVVSLYVFLYVFKHFERFYPDGLQRWLQISFLP